LDEILSRNLDANEMVDTVMMNLAQSAAPVDPLVLDCLRVFCWTRSKVLAMRSKVSPTDGREA